MLKVLLSNGILRAACAYSWRAVATSHSELRVFERKLSCPLYQILSKKELYYKLTGIIKEN